MKAYKTSSHLRSILKGISWRIIATADTIVIVFLITCLFDNCNLDNAFKIGLSEFFFKLFIYYLHERLWLKILKHQAKSTTEILKKSISWRFIATLTTFIISGIILESFNEIALYIALTELITKFLLYYLHEKLWLKLPLGRIRNFFLHKR
ncbi:MAG: DUF2061 domain-containing protein [Winogradskyella sp.]|uniref:DUF2061 domain-containing protein n=1 Tax=Winogradskyella sp. TaxID=1883156 RepID=UPI000F3EDA95|nr:DUF2061 domain-containing protein [Winogradskyella sp.]RNC88173.1 MAG: DUF2061 domain-containing protein [Winogradskyella sp.]